MCHASTQKPSEIISNGPRSSKGVQRGLHFLLRVGIAGPYSRDDTLCEGFAGVLGAAEAGEELAKLKITGHVIGAIGYETAEIRRGGVVIAGLRAFKRQTVAREGIFGIGGDKFLECFATACGRLGHRWNAGIIAAAVFAAKFHSRVHVVCRNQKSGNSIRESQKIRDGAGVRGEARERLAF